MTSGSRLSDRIPVSDALTNTSATQAVALPAVPERSCAAVTVAATVGPMARAKISKWCSKIVVSVANATATTMRPTPYTATFQLAER